MATRSTIAVQLANGQVKQVYAHWDGYIDGNGTLLQNHYNTQELAEELVSLGSISSLDKAIGEKRPFDPGYGEKDPVKKAEILAAYEAANEAGWTTFYARDRGEKLTIETYANYEMFRLSGQREEFNYVFANGSWSVSFDDSRGKWVSLSNLIKA